ncbi:MAG: hypothetical protein OXU31_07465, partial [Gammaproteobacteria bacterium]|nr:hypothetical protein [Gammaproteobacteria bacterium]
VSAGSTTANLDIGIVHDNLNEAAETIIVTLQPATHGSFSKGGEAGEVTLSPTTGANTGTGTINDDDSVTVALSGGGDVNEGSDATVTVTLSGATTTTTTMVAYTIGMTAANDNDAESADYTNTSGGSVSIDAGMTSATITVAADNDNLNEGDETFTVVAGTVTAAGASSVAGSPQTFTIKDDSNDATTVTIARHSNTAASVAEDATASFTVTLGGGTRTGAVTVPLSLSGLDAGEYDFTAPAMGDYDNDAMTADTAPPASATGLSVVFGIGADLATTAQTVTVNLNDDNLNEATETLTLAGENAGATGLRIGVGAISYASGGQSDTVMVTDNDAITVTIAPTAASVAEGGEAEFTVTLSTASAAAATVNFAAAIVAQTMTANAPGNPDFTLDTPSASPLTIAAGQTQGTVTIAINTDRLAEDAETLRLTVTGVTLGAAGGMVSTTFPLTSDVTIPQNAAAVYGVDFAASAPTEIVEGTATATTFTVELTGVGAFTGNIEVDWGFTAGETTAADFSGGTSPAGGTLTFTHADRSETFTVTTAQDALSEGGSDGDETFMLTLSAASSLNAARLNALGGVAIGGAHDVDITDTDDIVVSIARMGGGNVNEDGGTATFNVTTSFTPTAALIVPFSVSATSASAGDYTVNPSTGSIQIAANDSDGVQIVITASADDLLEGAETFDISLAAGGLTGGGGVAPVRHAADNEVTGVVIADAEILTVTLSGGGDVAEGSNAMVTVVLSGATVLGAADVAYAIGATSSAADNDAEAADYTNTGGGSLSIGAGMTSGTITIAAVDDTLNEGDETFIVTVTNADVAAGGGVSVVGGVQAFTIKDDANDAVEVAITAGQGSVVEGGTVVFTVTLRGGTSTEAVVIPYTIGGDVTAGDYTDNGGGSVSIGAGRSGGAFSIATVLDETVEEEEMLTVTGAAAGAGGLRTAGAVSYVGGGRSAGVVIEANAATVRDFAVRVDEADVEEGGAVVFTVMLGGRPPTELARVEFSIGGGADAADYTVSRGAGTLGFSALGETEVRFSIGDDDLNEGAEALTVTLGNARGGGDGGIGIAAAMATATIAASDVITYAIGGAGGAAVTVVEAGEEGGATFIVTLSGAAGVGEGGAVRVPFMVGGSAVRDADYTITGSPLVFSGGVGSRDIRVGVIDNEEYGPSKEVRIELETPVVGGGAGGMQDGGARFRGGTTSARVTIANDDALRVSVARNGDGSVAEGGTAEFTV